MTILMLDLIVFIFNYNYPSLILQCYIYGIRYLGDRDFPDLYPFHYSLTERCILYNEKNNWFLLTEWTIDEECNYF